MGKFVSFGEAVEALKIGKRVARDSWAKGTFIFMPIENEVNISIIPNMKSLPECVKNEFIRRHNETKENVNGCKYDYIYFRNQMTLVNPENEMNTYTATANDVLENDWLILD